jgi:hypothetical protein
MSTAAKKKIADPDEPAFDPSKMKRGPSRHANKRLVLPLAGVRTAAAKTQNDVSKASGIPQGEISRIENRDDLDVIAIATLRRYVAALGGTLELAAQFPNGARIIIATK